MTDRNLLEEIISAHHHGWAIAAVSVYDAVGAQAVVLAADGERRPVIIATGSSSFAFTGELPLAAAALAVRDQSAARSPVRVGVHLDHSRSLDELRRCLHAGYDSVMIDGSHLPFQENVAITRAAAEIAHRSGAWIEGELGALPGDEDRTVESGSGSLTDPGAARKFVEQTCVDVLAVAVGNVHGVPKAPVTLSLDRLADIRDAVDVPLVLHGASGLPDEQVRAAIALGVAKINVNTEVRHAYLTALRDSLTHCDSDDLTRHFSAAREAATTVIRTKIRVFDCSDPEPKENLA